MDYDVSGWHKVIMVMAGSVRLYTLKINHSKVLKNAIYSFHEINKKKPAPVDDSDESIKVMSWESCSNTSGNSRPSTENIA